MQRWRPSGPTGSPHVISIVCVTQWSETVSVIATACDLAVIPLPLDRPLERNKPETKLISFWRMGLPVVTSATPAYVRDHAGRRPRN